MIKEEGYTQAILSIILAQKNIEILVPATIKYEIKSHIHEVSRKSGLPVKIVGELASRFFRHARVIMEEGYSIEIKKALGMVNDPKDSPFAGLALKFSPSIILTYNKRHYIEKSLTEHGIRVFTPAEFVKYLDMDLSVSKRVKKGEGFLKLMSGLAILKNQQIKDK